MIVNKPVMHHMNKIKNRKLFRTFTLLTLAALICMGGNITLSVAAKAQSAKSSTSFGKVTGLPLPRFVSVRSSKVNARTGPALRYPIQWIYKRANMPVEITAEFDAWRQIKDIEGSVSWVHSTLLSGKRTAIIMAEVSEPSEATDDLIPAYKKANTQSSKVLEVENGAVGEIKKCVEGFCLVDFKSYRGWLAKNYLWGIYADEVIE
jgi:SH3-like domain-containing protein|tara:strand:+ start:427590 stop:428207 length:618 start_codon:yes stop_codon:yes gene_type:complete